MIGIQSSFVVFPINLVIVGIFRHSRPRKKKTKKGKTQQQPEPPQTEKDIPYETVSPQFDPNYLTVDFLIKVSPSGLINYAHYFCSNKTCFSNSTQWEHILIPWYFDITVARLLYSYTLNTNANKSITVQRLGWGYACQGYIYLFTDTVTM